MLILSERMAELLATFDVFAGNIQAASSSTQRAACNVEAASVKAGESDLETLTSLSNKISFRYFTIFEDH
jgi:hypothetical protein